MASNNEKTQQTISKIVEAHYGDLRGLFEAHDWTWQGNQSMNASASLIVEHYGSIRAFDAAHPISLFRTHGNALLMSEWRWVPDQSGSLNFRYISDRQGVIEKTNNPFLVLVYITNKAAKDQKYLENQVVGFLEVSHRGGDRAEFDSPDLEYGHRSSYNHALKVRRAFEFFPQRPVKILELLPDLRQRQTMIQDLNKGIVLTSDQLSTISRLPYKEVRVHGSESLFENEVFLPKDIHAAHQVQPEYNDPFHNNPSVYIKAAYGFHPHDWGCVGWNEPGRAKTLIKKTTNPFIMVNWVTYSSGGDLSGKVAGFYEVTHEEGLRQDFTASHNDAKFDEKYWKYSLGASRAWEILPEYQPEIMDFYPAMYEAKQERATGRWGAELPPDLVKKLKALPRREVEVYGQNRNIEPDIVYPDQNPKKGFVRGGPGRRSGYEVSEPKNTEKELYILKLLGDTEAFLGKKAHGKQIYKVGLSLSPSTRQSCLNAALPKGAYEWTIFRSTRLDNNAPYPDFGTAETGEMAMKKYLGENPGDPGNHLGGEFYLASDDMIEAAWAEGRKAALTTGKET